MTDDGDGDRETRGEEMLARISNELVRVQKKYFGKGPTQAKSYMLDDMLITVMRDGMTTAERTLIDFGDEDHVRQFRQLFENRMCDRFSAVVEKITGRKVVNYQSQVVFDPDAVVEIFFFDRPSDLNARAATAKEQLPEEEAGDTSGPDERPAAFVKDH